MLNCYQLTTKSESEQISSSIYNTEDVYQVSGLYEYKSSGENLKEEQLVDFLI